MDTRRLIVVVAVAAMLALAGCSGGQSTATTGTTDGETTPPGATTTPGGDSEGGGPDALETQPWMAEDGVNATTLLGAHHGSLSETSYRVETYQNSTGLFSLEQNGVQRIGSNGNSIYRYETKTSNGNSTTRAFVNDTWVLTEQSNETRTVYSDYPVGDSAESLNYTNQLVQYIRLGDYRLNRTYEADGETRIEYVATNASDVRGAQSITAYEGRLVVSANGRIHSLDVDAVQQAQYGNATSRFSFRLAKVGNVDVSTPPWVSTARERATTVDFSYEYNGSVLKVTHEGGDTVAAGSQLVITPTEGRGVLFTSLSEEFSPGETMYLSASSTNQLSVTFDSPPAPETGIGGPVNFAIYGANNEIVTRATVRQTTNGTVGSFGPAGEFGVVGYGPTVVA